MQADEATNGTHTQQYVTRVAMQAAGATNALAIFRSAYGLAALPEKSFYGREDGLLVPQYADLPLLSKYARDLELGKAKERTLCLTCFFYRRSSASIG
jgi:hypothetical protein